MVLWTWITAQVGTARRVLVITGALVVIAAVVVVAAALGGRHRGAASSARSTTTTTPSATTSPAQTSLSGALPPTTTTSTSSTPTCTVTVQYPDVYITSNEPYTSFAVTGIGAVTQNGATDNTGSATVSVADQADNPGPGDFVDVLMADPGSAGIPDPDTWVGPPTCQTTYSPPAPATIPPSGPTGATGGTP